MPGANGHQPEKSHRGAGRSRSTKDINARKSLVNWEAASNAVPAKRVQDLSRLEPIALPEVFLMGEKQEKHFSRLLGRTFQPRSYFDNADVRSIHQSCREMAIIQGALMGQARLNHHQQVSGDHADDGGDAADVSQPASHRITSQQELDALIKDTGLTADEIVARSAISGHNRDLQGLMRLQELARQLLKLVRVFFKRRLDQYELQLRRIKQKGRLAKFTYQKTISAAHDHLKYEPLLEDDAHFRGPKDLGPWEDQPEIGTRAWVDHFGWPPLLPGEDFHEYKTLYRSLISEVKGSGWFETYLVKQLADLEWMIERNRKAERVLLGLVRDQDEDGRGISIAGGDHIVINDGFSSQYAIAESLANRFFDEGLSVVELSDLICLASQLHGSLRGLIEVVKDDKDKTELARLKHIEAVRWCNFKEVF